MSTVCDICARMYVLNYYCELVILPFNKLVLEKFSRYYQWQIQDFKDGEGVLILESVAKTYNLVRFLPKLYGNERNWTLRGGRCVSSTPLDPPLCL